MQILAGDIGGTNTRLALFETSRHNPLLATLEQTYSSTAHPSIESILELFIKQHKLPRIERACFGLAGPVINQVCETTNLPWRVAATQINQKFGFNSTWLLNDLEANAWGIETLSTADLHTLNPGASNPSGNRSIISAGTGLGEAGLYWDGDAYHPFPSEGGHTDFSPSTQLEFALFEHLSERYNHVSWERLISGPGIETLYRFLSHQQNVATPQWLQEMMNSIGIAPAISQAALNQTDPICEDSLDLFIRLYAREAGNHALKIMATGGVYLGGGIAPQIVPLLQQGSFMSLFLAKGRMQPIMESMPVKIILNDKTALNGAARYALLR
jgi:glucokinase